MDCWSGRRCGKGDGVEEFNIRNIKGAGKRSCISFPALFACTMLIILRYLQ